MAKKMNRDLTYYSLFAVFFKYPKKKLEIEMKDCREMLTNQYPELVDEFDGFMYQYSEKSLTEIQEYFIKTFDVQALCYLDLGYVVFGDTFKRGQFLVHMQEEQKKINNECGTELADHLPNMLTLISKIDNGVFAEELSYCIVIPALKEMIKNFGEGANMYKTLLTVLTTIFERDFHDLNLTQVKIEHLPKPGFINKKGCNPFGTECSSKEGSSKEGSSKKGSSENAVCV